MLFRNKNWWNCEEKQWQTYNWEYEKSIGRGGTVGDVTVNNKALFLKIGGQYKDIACTLTFLDATFHK